MCTIIEQLSKWMVSNGCKSQIFHYWCTNLKQAEIEDYNGL